MGLLDTILVVLVADTDQDHYVDTTDCRLDASVPRYPSWICSLSVNNNLTTFTHR